MRRRDTLPGGRAPATVFVWPRTVTVGAVRPADAHLGLEEESSGWRTLGPPVRPRAWPALGSGPEP